MNERVEEIDGWKVRLLRAECGEYPRYKAEARSDVFGRYAETYAENSHDVLSKLAAVIELDREKLLSTFGSQP